MKTQMYAAWLQEGREDLRRAVVFNELITGQNASWFERFAALDGWLPLDVDFNHMYMMLTGIKRSIYRQFQMDATAYSRLAIEFYIQAEDILREYGFRSECFMDIYGQDKLLYLFFSPEGDNAAAPDEAARAVAARLQSMYERRFLPENATVCNFSVLSGRISAYEAIAPASEKLRNWHKISFFHMKQVVLTDALYKELYRPVEPPELRRLLRELDDALSHGIDAHAYGILHTLLCIKLKYAFSQTLLTDALVEIRALIARYAQIYDLDGQALLVDRSDAYNTIEDLATDVWEKLQVCVDAVRRKKNLSYITQTAIFFIKENYASPIALADVANSAHVVPNYMSRLFNQEMGMSIPAYISKIRLKKAGELLQNSNLRIKEIAETVGLRDVKLFNKKFKSEFGVVPGEYRNQNR